METQRSPKNLLMISVDTLRADALGVSTNRSYLERMGIKKRFSTPTMDRLAREGFYVESCLSAGSITSTSHASFFTGLRPNKHGVHLIAGTPLSDKIETVFEIFANNGFETHSAIDFDTIFDLSGLNRALNKHDITGGYDSFVDALSKNKRDGRAFFSFVHFGNLHPPYMLGFGTEAKEKELALDRYRECFRKLKLDTSQIRRDAKSHELWAMSSRLLKAAEKNGSLVADYFSLYFEGVQRFDKGRFRRFMAALNSKGLLEDTALVLFGDHGEMLPQHSHHKLMPQLPGHAGYIHDEVLRVPLIFWSKSGLRNKFVKGSRFCSVDLLPTVLDWMKIRYNRRKLDGASRLSARVRGSEKTGPYGFAESALVDCGDFARLTLMFLGNGGKIIGKPPRSSQGIKLFHTLRNEQFKLIRDFDGGEHLYDLCADPLECKDLLGALPQNANLAKSASSLSSALDRLLQKKANVQTRQRSRHQKKRSGARKIIRDLKALGYL